MKIVIGKKEEKSLSRGDLKPGDWFRTVRVSGDPDKNPYTHVVWFSITLAYMMAILIHARPIPRLLKSSRLFI